MTTGMKRRLKRFRPPAEQRAKFKGCPDPLSLCLKYPSNTVMSPRRVHPARRECVWCVCSTLRQRADPVYSPPLQISGLCWRLKVYPVSFPSTDALTPAACSDCDASCNPFLIQFCRPVMIISKLF